MADYETMKQKLDTEADKIKIKSLKVEIERLATLADLKDRTIEWLRDLHKEINDRYYMKFSDICTPKFYFFSGGLCVLVVWAAVELIRYFC